MYTLLILTVALASGVAFMESIKTFLDANCTDTEFICGNLQCIPQSKQCDNHHDCTDFSDEMDCDLHLCQPPHYFRCKNSRCISSAFVCNEENDCDDFSDEENCEKFQQLLQSNSTCPSGQWQCTDKLCIPQDWVCNGESDCLDGSDEALGCSFNISCDGFKCDNGHCVPSEWKCDGHDDCRDNSDEVRCNDPEECTLEAQRFLCGDGKSCIHLSQVCDGKTQCSDRSDEGSACNRTCDGCSHECLRLPSGPKCVCPRGYRTVDDKHCEDINECEIYGICDQKCKNKPGSYECFCDHHYLLQADKRSCKAHSGEAIMLFTSKNEIRAFVLKAELYFPIVKNLRQVVGVDFDGQFVYWTDIFAEHESIMRSLKDGTEKEVLVTSGLGAPEDLHVDHITGNIYFTDAERQHIGVCTNNGDHCTVLINKDIHKPRGIVLYPEEGEMYWTDWGHSPRIARSSMDGSQDTPFVSSDIHWPNGLTIDYPNDRLYWTDAKLTTLESIRLDGTDRRTILSGVVKHPYAIAVFENLLFWSDWATHSIQACDKFTGKDHHIVIKEKKDYIYGISIYHPSLRQKPQSNPCISSFCSDICLLSGPKSYTCACPQDKTLGDDGHTCKYIGKKQKLIVGADNALIEVEYQALGKHGLTWFPFLAKKIGALAFNSVNNSLYMSDLETRRIISINLHSWVPKSLDIKGLGRVVAMDYDYLGNNLYWCDADKGTIEVMNLNTKSKKVLIHDMHGETPESIALVPEEGVMYVAFQKLDQHESHVDRMLMDGTRRTHTIDRGLTGPISLSYDSDLHRIFLSDAGTGNIESTSVEGDDRHGFRSLLPSPIGITSLKSEVFWVNEKSKAVFWADKYNSADNDYNKKIILDLPKDVDRMHIISITPKRIGLSPCQHHNGNCSHLCLHTQKSIVCACPVGMRLDDDNKTCTKRVDCVSNEFFCGKSNTCIPNLFRCDGTEHCPNGEDEDDCKIPNHCPLDSFQCQDGECIKEVYRCNQKYDCKDKSDEHNCSHVETQHCPPNHFRCKNGDCIKDRFICDGVNDCVDSEDEANCVSTQCKDSEFRCSSGACIPKSWECDHDYDCPDMSDEHADCVSCPQDMFTCATGKCIDRNFICNHEDDCGDNSDEISCEEATKTCKEDEFSCASHTSICLPTSARCNGSFECPHEEDERNCSSCRADEFICQNHRCIPPVWVCDRTDDCGDNSDEAPSLCLHSSPPNKLLVTCNDNFQCVSGNCIDMSLVCNGERDCHDGSDEGGVCSTSCNAINNPCSQICIKTPTGPMCKCQQGFHLHGDGQNCQDIDECENHPPVCSQICHNTAGGHLCDCYEGFIMRSDRISCKADGRAMSMIFTSDNQIRELSQMENSLKMVHDSSDTPKITGLDVCVKTGTIYFSIENSGTILMVRKNNPTAEYIEDVGQPQKLSLDWVTNNVYYVNNQPDIKSISICNFDSKACSRLIPIDVHRQVSALAVDAANKFLFYSLTSWWIFNSPSYVIYKTNLDGTGSHELIKSRSGYITGLAYDLHKKELYYVDSHQGQLGKISYDGTMNVVLLSNLTRPVGLNFFENHLYFLTVGGFMERCRLYSPTTCDSFSLDSHSTDLFAIVQESRQPVAEENPCRNHSCSYLCVPTQVHFGCLCEDGKVVSPGEECGNAREANDADGKRVFAIHRHEHSYSSSSMGPTIAGIMISICLLTFGVVFYYLIKKKNSGTFNISMRFHNPAYGLHTDEDEKSILQPGQHEYSNPVEFYEAEADNNKRENLLVDV
ncbi:vitellogenin receptor, partial [Asbolus verrucosus]